MRRPLLLLREDRYEGQSSPRSRPPRVSRWSSSWSGPSAPAASRDAKSLTGSSRRAAPADAFLGSGHGRRLARRLDRLAGVARLEAAPDDWQASAALGIAYVQQARVTSDPSTYPLAQAALRRSLAAPAHGQRRGPRRARHPRRGPARLHRRAPMGSPRRARRLRTTPTPTGCSATRSSSSGATGGVRIVPAHGRHPAEPRVLRQGQLRPRAPGERRRRDRCDASGLRRGRPARRTPPGRRRRSASSISARAGSRRPRRGSGAPGRRTPARWTRRRASR